MATHDEQHAMLTRPQTLTSTMHLPPSSKPCHQHDRLLIEGVDVLEVPDEVPDDVPDDVLIHEASKHQLVRHVHKVQGLDDKEAASGVVSTASRSDGKVHAHDSTGQNSQESHEDADRWWESESGSVIDDGARLSLERCGLGLETCGLRLEGPSLPEGRDILETRSEPLSLRQSCDFLSQSLPRHPAYNLGGGGEMAWPGFVAPMARDTQIRTPRDTQIRTTSSEMRRCNAVHQAVVNVTQDGDEEAEEIEEHIAVDDAASHDQDSTATSPFYFHQKSTTEAEEEEGGEEDSQESFVGLTHGSFEGLAQSRTVGGKRLLAPASLVPCAPFSPSLLLADSHGPRMETLEEGECGSGVLSSLTSKSSSKASHKSTKSSGERTSELLLDKTDVLCGALQGGACAVKGRYRHKYLGHDEDLVHDDDLCHDDEHAVPDPQLPAQKEGREQGKRHTSGRLYADETVYAHPLHKLSSSSQIAPVSSESGSSDIIGIVTGTPTSRPKTIQKSSLTSPQTCSAAHVCKASLHHNKYWADDAEGDAVRSEAAVLWRAASSDWGSPRSPAHGSLMHQTYSSSHSEVTLFPVREVHRSARVYYTRGHVRKLRSRAWCSHVRAAASGFSREAAARHMVMRTRSSTEVLRPPTARFILYMQPSQS